VLIVEQITVTGAVEAAGAATAGSLKLEGMEAARRTLTSAAIRLPILYHRDV
jgi:hypothetical protein